jgi:ribosomal protein S18 acetylase RimI-like enzyme
MAHIQEIQARCPELTCAVGRLLTQLTKTVAPPADDALDALLADSSVTLLAAWQDDAIVGFALIAVYRRLSGTVAHLEDVVVDQAARGAGIGEALVRAAAAVARARGADRIELTTSPAREPANRLYRRLGYQRRETNVYGLDL